MKNKDFLNKYLVIWYIKLLYKLKTKKTYIKIINMYQMLRLNKEKITNLTVSFLLLLLLILLLFGFKNDEKIIDKKISRPITASELDSIKSYIIKRIESPFVNIDYKIKKGDTIQKILKKMDINNSEIQQVINQYKKYGNSNQLLAGNIIEIIVQKKISETANSIIKFSVPITKSTSIEITKDEENRILSKKIITKLYKKTTFVENVIKNNLYKSGIEVKLNPDAIIEFARIFGFEIDFQRDIRKNDYFKIVYDRYLDENGEFVKSGSIHYAHMTVNSREITLYKFGDDEEYGYFDADGKSVEKALMKTPINGARLSSPFGMRKHPILGFNKKHMGTDFAAPMGTPIMASGSGTVTRAKWCGGGGNCIKIKHNSTYETIYAHMKNFAKGIKVGKKVKQGQIIGYVGSTGMSTGPHLHYEVIVNGKKVNSQTLKLPSGKVLKDEERKLFEIHRIKTDVLIAELIAKKLN